MKTATARFAALALLTLALATSCDRTPTRPSTRVPPEGPQPPVEVITTRIELIVPRTLAPGGTAQLSLIAHRSDVNCAPRQDREIRIIDGLDQVDEVGIVGVGKEG